MKSFTPTEFRADSSKVYNSVMIEGIVRLEHRDRPSMLIMTEEELVKITDEQIENYIQRNNNALV